MLISVPDEYIFTENIQAVSNLNLLDSVSALIFRDKESEAHDIELGK